MNDLDQLTGSPQGRSRQQFSGRHWRGNLLLTAPFICLFLVQLLHHQMWRDELNAWGIAAASRNLAELFHYVHYEGHPSLWYLLLWVASRFTDAVIGLKVVQAVVGVTLYLMVGLWSPFSRLEKVLLFLSYFLSFEYTVIARMYGLVTLLTFAYCIGRSRYPERVVANAVLLGLLANADVVGILLSGALGLEYMIWQVKRVRVGEGRGEKLFAPISIYVGLLCCAFWSLKPARDISWRTTGHLFQFASDWAHLAQVGRYVLLEPWWPIQSDYPHHYWNPQGDFHLRYVALSLLLISVYWLIFRSRKTLLVVIGLTALSSILFNHLIYFGSTRHFGITFVAFIAAYWLLRHFSKDQSWLAIGLLAISAAAGIAVIPVQWRSPFSNAKATAQWIKLNGPDRAALIGSPDTSVVGVAEYLQRPMYYLDCDCSGRFLLFANRRDNFAPEQIPDRIVVASEKLGTGNMLLVLAHPLSEEQRTALTTRKFQVQKLTEFVGAEAFEEDFYLYSVRSVTT